MAGISRNIGAHIQAFYGEIRPSSTGKKTGFDFPMTIGLRTVIRLLLWALLILELVLIHYFGIFVITQQQVFTLGSRIEVEYQRRENLLPRLSMINKEYSRHELGLMNYVSDARSLEKSAEKLKSLLGPAKAAQAGQVFTKLIALAEQYPNLKADQSCRVLMEKTVATENRISAAREKYNAMICHYNLEVTTFPTSLFAKFLNFEPMDVYEPQKEPKPAENGRFTFVY
jgi:LemA protein